MFAVIIATNAAGRVEVPTLSAIPCFLEMQQYRFGNDVSYLLVTVRLADVESDPGSAFNYFAPTLPVQPAFEYKVESNHGRLHLTYTSRYTAPSDDTSPAAFEEFLAEFGLIVNAIGPDFEDVCDFQWRMLVHWIDQQRTKEPYTPGDIQRLYESSFWDRSLFQIPRPEEYSGRSDVILANTSWLFDANEYTRTEFDKAISTFNADCPNAVWDPAEIVIKSKTATLQLTGDPDSKPIQLTAPNGKHFTTADFFFVLHHALIPLVRTRLSEGRDTFFEGLVSEEAPKGRRSSVFSLLLGS